MADAVLGNIPSITVTNSETFFGSGNVTPTENFLGYQPSKDGETNSHQSAGTAKNAWYDRFIEMFGWDIGATYADTFTKHLISPTNPEPLTDDHMKEMEIPIGHRRQIANLLQVIRTAAQIGNLEHHGSDLASNFSDHNDPLERIDTVYHFANPLVPSKSVALMEGLTLQQSTMHLTCGVKWIDFEGHTNSLDSFFDLVESTMFRSIEGDEIPSHFLRAFWNNKPTPFHVKSHTKRGRTCSLLLLRIPTLLMTEHSNERSSELSQMTNRFVIIYVPKSVGRGGWVLTYHKEKTESLPWLDDLKKDWDMIEHLSRERFLMHLLSEAMLPCHDVMTHFRCELESLVGIKVSYLPTQVVEWMSYIHQRAQIMRRYLGANKSAVEDFGKTLETADTQTVMQFSNDLASAAEELEQNAMDAMNLRMGLVGFRSQENMKFFTYVSAVTSPMAVFTGWYGMNFETMPELPFEYGYHIFIGFSVCIVAFMVWLIHYFNQDTSKGNKDLESHVHAAVRKHMKRKRLQTQAASTPGDSHLLSEGSTSNEVLSNSYKDYEPFIPERRTSRQHSTTADVLEASVDTKTEEDLISPSVAHREGLRRMLSTKRLGSKAVFNTSRRPSTPTSPILVENDPKYIRPMDISKIQKPRGLPNNSSVPRLFDSGGGVGVGGGAAVVPLTTSPILTALCEPPGHSNQQHEPNNNNSNALHALHGSGGGNSREASPLTFILPPRAKNGSNRLLVS